MKTKSTECAKLKFKIAKQFFFAKTDLTIAHLFKMRNKITLYIFNIYIIYRSTIYIKLKYVAR